MIETFRTSDTIRARAARLTNLRKLAHETIPLGLTAATGDTRATADEAQAVAAYAYGYLDGLRRDTMARTYAHSTIGLDTNVQHAEDWALHCRDNADVITDRARRLRGHTAA